MTAVIPAKAVRRRAYPPLLIRSNLAEDGIAPQTLILVLQTNVLRTTVLRTDVLATGVMQTRREDASGLMGWNLCVWRITVIGSEQNVVQREIIFDSI